MDSAEIVFDTSLENGGTLLKLPLTLGCWVDGLWNCFDTRLVTGWTLKLPLTLGWWVDGLWNCLWHQAVEWMNSAETAFGCPFFPETGAYGVMDMVLCIEYPSAVNETFKLITPLSISIQKFSLSICSCIFPPCDLLPTVCNHRQFWWILAVSVSQGLARLKLCLKKIVFNNLKLNDC